jgi:hypothetical protein
MYAVFKQSVCYIWQFAFDQEFLLKSPPQKSPVKAWFLHVGGEADRRTDLKRTFALRDIVGMPPETFVDQKMSGSSFTVTTRRYNTRIYLWDGVVDLVTRL